MRTQSILVQKEVLWNVEQTDMKSNQWVGRRVKLWQTITHMLFQRWRLIPNPTERNKYIKLELLRAWEPTRNRCPLSFSEGKFSQGFVLEGEKTISGSDVVVQS